MFGCSRCRNVLWRYQKAASFATNSSRRGNITIEQLEEKSKEWVMEDDPAEKKELQYINSGKTPRRRHTRMIGYWDDLGEIQSGHETVRSILAGLVATRKSGKKIDDFHEKQLYQLFLKRKRGENLTLMDESITRRFDSSDNSVETLTKLTHRLEKKEWFGLAHRVQKIIVAQQEGEAKVTALKRAAELSTMNRDFDAAKFELEEAQSILTHLMLDEAAAERDGEKATAQYEKAVSLAGEMDLPEALFRYSTFLLSLDPKAAAMKLHRALGAFRKVTKDIISKKGVLPSLQAKKAEEFPILKKRIDQLSEEIKNKHGIELSDLVH